MAKTQEETYDVVVVGSGAAAFSTALGAVDEGLSVIMLESSDQWGGTLRCPVVGSGCRIIP